MNKPNILIRALTWIWHGIDGFRKLLHLFLLLVLFGIFLGAALRSAPPIIAARSALEIRPLGYLVEQFEGDPFQLAKL